MLRFRVRNKNEYQEFEHPSGRIELGRAGPQNDVPRCVIKQDRYVSANHLAIQEKEGGIIQVENLSNTNAIHVRSQSPIATRQSRDLALPAFLTIGETQIEIEGAPISGEGKWDMLEQSRRHLTSESSAHTSLLELGQTPTPETLTHWFETVISIQRAAAGSPEFYLQAARAVVDLVGLDRGMVILRLHGRWMVQARFPDSDTRGREFSMTILERVAREQRTFFQSSASIAATTESMQGVEALVASPIFGAQSEVVGALYGCRTRHTRHSGVGIGPLEAQVMQLLASVVEVGLARQHHEAEASRLRVQFEQFFTADLARELEKNPHLLKEQLRQITVLFSDIRNFSRISELLGPTDTCRLVSEVMECLTTQVHSFEGVVVDYTGDGLMAMWNAPRDVDKHAVKACHAALGMLRQLPELETRWKEQIGRPLRLGIGLNTGQALCGNTGSKHKFKYGPLGHAVNVASRVEGATKFLGVPVMITGSTFELIKDEFATRRLCEARVRGIDGTVELYELHDEQAKAAPEWDEWRRGYEQALTQYQTKEWSQAAQSLHALLLGNGEPDVPTLTLLARSLELAQTPPRTFDGVIEIPFK